MNSDLYIGPPFLSSRQSENAFVGDGYLGVYENQIVEAQMCGVAVLGSKYSIAPELLSPFQSSYALNFDNSASIIENVVRTLGEAQDSRSQISHWAKEQHNSVTTMRLWLSKLQNHQS